MPTTYLPPTYNLTTYLPTNPPTYLNVLPTYLSTHIPTYILITYLSYPFTHLDVLFTYLPTYPPTQLPCPTTYLPN
jgi:hypothetical protein